MAGFRNFRDLSDSLTSEGRTWLSTFRKVPAATATVTGQWFDYGYAAGNPIPNYYAASPLVAAALEPEKGIFVPRMAAGFNQFLHRLTVMTVSASATGITNQAQPLILCDYLLFYPFVDMDAAGEDQTMDNTIALPRYTDGVGVQMMMVNQSSTVGSGRFTVTYIGSDDVQYTTPSLYGAAAGPSGAITSAVGAVGGLQPFIPLNAGVSGVKSVVSVNFSVAHGGLCVLVLVKPLETIYVNEESRRTTTGTLESFGDATEKESLRQRAGIVEIKDGAFLGFIGQGTQGSLASAPLVGTIETVWR